MLDYEDGVMKISVSSATYIPYKIIAVNWKANKVNLDGIFIRSEWEKLKNELNIVAKASRIPC